MTDKSSTVFTCQSTCYVPSVGSYYSLLSVALSVWLPLLAGIQVGCASVGFVKDIPHHNGKLNEKSLVITLLYFSIPCCVNDKMEPCSDMNSLMWCIMQCMYGVTYLAG